jgi:predicted methyltransferase
MAKDQGPKDRIGDLYHENSIEDIVSITGIPLYLVIELLHELAEEGLIDIRKQGGQAYLDNPGKNLLESLKKHGFSQMDMARYLGCSKKTIQRWLDEE